MKAKTRTFREGGGPPSDLPQMPEGAQIRAPHFSQLTCGPLYFFQNFFHLFCDAAYNAKQYNKWTTLTARWSLVVKRISNCPRIVYPTTQKNICDFKILKGDVSTGKELEKWQESKADPVPHTIKMP